MGGSIESLVGGGIAAALTGLAAWGGKVFIVWLRGREAERTSTAAKELDRLGAREQRLWEIAEERITELKSALEDVVAENDRLREDCDRLRVERDRARDEHSDLARKVARERAEWSAERAAYLETEARAARLADENARLRRRLVAPNSHGEA